MVQGKNIVKILSLFLLVILSLNIVMADNVTAYIDTPFTYYEYESMINANNVYSEDFMLSTISSSDKSCKCAISVDRLALINTGNVDSAYRLTITGKDSKYIELSEEQFVLKSGQSDELDVFIKAPCSKNEVDFNIEIDTVIGTHKAYSKNLELLKCNNIGAEFMTSNSYKNEPCRALEYKFKVTNTGSFIEDYKFSVANIPEKNIRFLADSATLLPAQSIEITMFAQFDCSVYGLYEGDLIINADKSETSTKLKFLAEITQDYDFRVTSGSYEFNDGIRTANFKEDKEEYQFCAGKEYALPILISNTANVNNAFKLTEENKINFVSKDAEILEINATSAEYFTIRASPEFEDLGRYNYSLQIESDKGDMQATKQIDINVVDCDSFNLEIIDYDKVCTGENEYELFITNTGINKNTIKLEAISDLGIPVDLDSEVDVEANETVALTLKINSTDSKANSENFEIKAIVSDNSKRNATANLFVDYVSKEKCYEARLTGKLSSIYFEEKVQNIQIKNTGFWDGSYKIEMTSPSWMSLTKDQVYLTAGNKTDIPIYFRPCSKFKEGVYAISIKATADNGIEYNYETTLILKEKSTFDKIMIFLEDYKLVVIFGIVLIFVILLILYLIFNKSSTVFIIIILILILLLGAGLFTYISNIQTSGPDSRIVEQGLKTLSGNSDICFVNYENDKLSFDLTVYEESDEVIYLGNLTDCPLSVVSRSVGENYTNQSYICSNKFLILENLEGKYDFIFTFESEESKNAKFKAAETERIAEEIKGNETILNTTIANVEDLNKTDININETTLKGNATENNETFITGVVIDLTAAEQLYQYVVENNLTDSIEYQIWNKNRVYQIDLNKWFVDYDDGDILSFSSTIPRHMNITIDDGIVRLVPEKDWSGVSYITFKAKDQNNAETVSPEIALIVQDKETFTIDTIKEFINNNVLYVVAGTVIFILVILILVLGRNPESGKQQKLKKYDK